MFLLASVLLASVVAAGPISLNARQSAAQAFASNSDLSLKLSSYDAPILNGGDQGGVSKTWKLTVNEASKKQNIEGFGACITDSTVTVFNELSGDRQSQLLQDLFSSNGAGFQLMRHTVASSDLSSNPYSYDDANGQADPGLNNFNLGDSGNAMVSFIKAARSVGDFKLLGSPWAPPGWMQLDGVLTGTTTNNNLNHDYADAYAQYFVKYLQAFESGGAHVDAITLQNEPLNSQSSYPTMYIFSDESAGLIQNNVGPALAGAGLSTKVWAYDHNTDQPDYPNAVLNGAGGYVDTVAWHCYAPNNNWGVLSDFHNSHPGATQIMTECWTSPETSWNQAADFTMGPLQNWAGGALAWVLGTDTGYGPHTGGCATCRGLFIVDRNSGEYALQVDYYMLAQFSRFMPRGATVLDGSGSYDYGNGEKVEAVASVNPDGSRTLVVENTFGEEIWLSTEMSDGTWNGKIAASGVTTWVLPPAGAGVVAGSSGSSGSTGSTGGTGSTGNGAATGTGKVLHQSGKSNSTLLL